MLFEAEWQKILVLLEQGKATSRRVKRWDSPALARCSHPAMAAGEVVLAEPRLAAVKKGCEQ